MPPERKAERGLAPREQQIMDVFFRVGKASVSEIRDQLIDAPSYSAVRTMIGQLERKGYLKRDREGVKHLYTPIQSRRTACRSAFRRLIETFFPESPGDAVAALIDESAAKLTDDDLNVLQQAIDRARKEGR